MPSRLSARLPTELPFRTLPTRTSSVSKALDTPIALKCVAYLNSATTMVNRHYPRPPHVILDLQIGHLHVPSLGAPKKLHISSHNFLQGHQVLAGCPHDRFTFRRSLQTLRCQCMLHLTIHMNHANRVILI
jgi:hypothetical protein